MDTITHNLPVLHHMVLRQNRVGRTGVLGRGKLQTNKKENMLHHLYRSAGRAEGELYNSPMRKMSLLQAQ